MRIVSVVGTRPQLIKAAALSPLLRQRHDEVFVDTGQHWDEAMAGSFFAELGLPRPDESLATGAGTHAQQTGRMLAAVADVLVARRPDAVLVYGDTNSTLAGTLAAAKLNIPVAHVEAGLRSFDRRMPEEINRIVADEFSELLLVHCQEAIDNLRREGIEDHRIHFVGNTMIDSLVAFEPRFRALEAATRLGLHPDDFLLVTLHRPALVDGPLLREVMDRLCTVAKQLPVVFPVHPRTRKMLGGFDAPAGLLLTEPLGYLEFLSLEADAAAVLTDSGGVQEETTFLGVPCFTLRDSTERPVTIRVGTNTLLGLDPSRIDDIPSGLRRISGTQEPPPLWDGAAAERVAESTTLALSDGRAMSRKPEEVAPARKHGAA